MIFTDAEAVRGVYREAAERGWVIPCICTENLTTTEAILSAVQEYGREHGIEHPMITVAVTCNYSHRSQAPNYTHTRDWKTGLRLFCADVEALAGKGGYFEDLRVLTHLDHIQYDADAELTASDLSGYSSIMYDASALPFEENIRLTKEFVQKKRDEIMIEGACDEIVDATGTVHNALTTPEAALRYVAETGVDLIVANLGTEHRATGKELMYHADVARRIRDKIGKKIVLHGASSASNEQLKNLFSDGVVKVNIWTALERDSAPGLLEELVKNAERVAGPATVRKLIEEGYLTEKCDEGVKNAITHFTTVYRQDIVFAEMKRMVRAYLDMWYR